MGVMNLNSPIERELAMSLTAEGLKKEATELTYEMLANWKEYSFKPYKFVPETLEVAGNIHPLIKIRFVCTLPLPRPCLTYQYDSEIVSPS